MKLIDNRYVSMDHDEKDWATVIRRSLFDLDMVPQSTATVETLASRMEGFAMELRRALDT